MSRNKKLLIASFTIFAASVVLYGCARWVPGFSDFYVTYIYRRTAGFFSMLFSWIPFSVSELLLYCLLLWILIRIIHFIMNLRPHGVEKTQQKPLSLLRSDLTGACLAVSILLFLYVTHCGINYYHTDFASISGLSGYSYTVADLENYCRYLTSQLNDLEDEIEKDENGLCASKDSYYKTGALIMEELGRQYPALDGNYPPAKPVIFSELLSYQSLCGIYSPFTVEANVNRDMSGFNIPFTICHELSHLKGFMQEEEANFIACLACTGSDDSNFQYSGYLLAYIYAMNELHRYDTLTYANLEKELCKTAQADLAADGRFWSSYEGKMSEFSAAVNDAYLKANAQADGINSYNRVVSLLLADYLKNISKADGSQK